MSHSSWSSKSLKLIFEQTHFLLALKTHITLMRWGMPSSCNNLQSFGSNEWWKEIILDIWITVYYGEGGLCAFYGEGHVYQVEADWLFPNPLQELLWGIVRQTRNNHITAESLWTKYQLNPRGRKGLLCKCGALGNSPTSSLLLFLYEQHRAVLPLKPMHKMNHNWGR